MAEASGRSVADIGDIKSQTTAHDVIAVVKLAGEYYGITAEQLREIVRMQEITEVPNAPAHVEGVINLRGRIVPVVDLRKRFTLSVGERNRDNRILVVDIGGHDIGVVVDAVTEVLRISSDSVEPPSAVITTADSVYLLGIVKLEGRLVILLDLEKVLTESEKNALSEPTAMAAD